MAETSREKLPGPMLVVGGRTGIGRAIASWYPGSQVWSRSTNGVDATDPDSIRAASEQYLGEHGAPYALIHSVGDFEERSLLDTSDESMRHLLESNLCSAFHVTQALVPAMIEAGRGRVLLFGAAGVGQATAKVRAPWYFAVKAALLSLTRSLAKEAAAGGVTVNMISPGLILHENSHAESQKRMESRVPLGRVGSPEDLRGAVDTLLGDGGRYVTGDEWTIDGGLSL